MLKATKQSLHCAEGSMRLPQNWLPGHITQHSHTLPRTALLPLTQEHCLKGCYFLCFSAGGSHRAGQHLFRSTPTLAWGIPPGAPVQSQGHRQDRLPFPATLGVKILVFFLPSDFWGTGTHLVCPSGVTPGSILKDYSWRCSGNHVWCLWIEPGQPHAAYIQPCTISLDLPSFCMGNLQPLFTH